MLQKEVVEEIDAKFFKYNFINYLNVSYYY